MISEVRQVIATALALPLERVFYGYDEKAPNPPFVAITDLVEKYDRDTGGLTLTNATFVVHVFDKTWEDSDASADKVIEAVDSYLLTNDTMGVFAESKSWVPVEKYVYHVQIAFSSQENYT